jgi:ketosteroid isomerase-like protein
MEPAEVNAEIVRRGYQALNEADMGALVRFFGEKVSWHTPGRSHVGGNYRGRDSVIAQFLRYIDETDGTFKVALQDVFTSDDGRAVGVHHSSAERNGKRLDLAGCVTLHVKSGRIVSGREHFFDLYAWDAFWS